MPWKPEYCKVTLGLSPVPWVSKARPQCVPQEGPPAWCLLLTSSLYRDGWGQKERDSVSPILQTGKTEAQHDTPWSVTTPVVVFLPLLDLRWGHGLWPSPVDLGQRIISVSQIMKENLGGLAVSLPFQRLEKKITPMTRLRSVSLGPCGRQAAC